MSAKRSRAGSPCYAEKRGAKRKPLPKGGGRGSEFVGFAAARPTGPDAPPANSLGGERAFASSRAGGDGRAEDDVTGSCLSIAAGFFRRNAVTGYGNESRFQRVRVCLHDTLPCLVLVNMPKNSDITALARRYPPALAGQGCIAGTLGEEGWLMLADATAVLSQPRSIRTPLFLSPRLPLVIRGTFADSPSTSCLRQGYGKASEDSVAATQKTLSQITSDRTSITGPKPAGRAHHARCPADAFPASFVPSGHQTDP
jgi:hypothetical protein